MELLIIKNGNGYFRITDSCTEQVGLTKASVYPLDELPVVQGHLKVLRATGYPDAAIHQLTLRERPFREETA